MATRYKYDKLRDSTIRLVRFKSSSDGDLLATLASFSLGQAPPYTALSYRWGASDRDCSIPADGHALGVTASVETFAREVQSRQATDDENSQWAFGWLWIDAVCINQEDNVERSQQVRLMKDIYEGATLIVVWLGEVEPGTDDAISLLAEIADLDCGAECRLSQGSMPNTTCRIGDTDIYVETLYETLTFDVGSVLRSDYWNRAWIIQEASTPLRDRTLVCYGNQTVSWHIFSKANNTLLTASTNNDVEHLADLRGVASEDIATIDYIRGRRSGNIYYESLYSMLVRSRTSVATDPRDKVYCVLGIAIESGVLQLQPDYTLSVEETYTRAASAIIEIQNSLMCLGSAGIDRDHEVPSWVPDWTVQHHRIPQPFYQYDRVWNREDGTLKEERSLFNADRGLVSARSLIPAFGVLTAYGFHFEDVEAVSCTREAFVYDTAMYWNNWTALARPDESKYPSGCTRFEAFCKVLKADFREVWGDWSAERGGHIEDFPAAYVNAFKLQDSILDAMTWQRRLFTTSSGHLGLCAFSIEPGDRVCILHGSQVPVVLREEEDHWLLVGQAYIHGIMDGEAVEAHDSAENEAFEIW